MKKLIAIIIGLLISHKGFAQTPEDDIHWQLIWEDQFNSFDNTKWVKAHYCNGDGRNLFLEQNVWTSNGNLVIKVDNSKAVCPSPPPSPTAWACGGCVPGIYNYTTGWVESRHTYNTRFGYIEARIKLPHRLGFWPAFWTFAGDGVQASNAAEIDIFEMLGELPPNTVTTNTHRFYDIPDAYHYQEHVLSNFDYRDWHTYAIEWSPTRIIWYIDNKAIRVLTNHNIIDSVRIILNTGIRPNDFPPTSPPFSDYMYVDYVKVYRLKYDCNTVINEISNFSTFNYAVRKSISLSNLTIIPTNSNISLRATDFIELKAGFEVPIGAELYLDVNPCE